MSFSQLTENGTIGLWLEGEPTGGIHSGAIIHKQTLSPFGTRNNDFVLILLGNEYPRKLTMQYSYSV